MKITNTHKNSQCNFSECEKREKRKKKNYKILLNILFIYT